MTEQAGDPPASEAPPPSRVSRIGPALSALLPGLLLAVAVGVVATLVGRALPIIGAPVVGIVIGVLLRRSLGELGRFTRGVAVSQRVVLQAGIVLMGAGISLPQIVHTGWRGLPVMVGTLVVALLGTVLIGRWLKIEQETRTLIGAGTAICGASAIATVSAVIGAAQIAVIYSVTTIFVFNVLAAVTFPLLGHALGLSQTSFGLWAGTAINDTSSVVAAASAYGPVATQEAIVVKLTRALMIVPLSVALAARQRRNSTGQLPWRRFVPPFLVLFLVAAAVNSVGMIPTGWHDGIGLGAGFFITVALSAVGLATPFDAVRKAGWRPLALGGLLWLLVSVSSLGLQAATGVL